MARRRSRIAQRAPAPWPRLILDSGGLGKVAENDEGARAAMSSSAQAGVSVIVPSVVLAESLSGTNRDAGVYRVLRHLVVVDIHADHARVAATLKSGAGLTGVEHTIDALVVAVAVLEGGGAILTTDPQDIRALAAARSDVKIRAISL